MREGKGTEYDVCIAGYYNTKSLRNTRFGGGKYYYLKLGKVWKQLRYHCAKSEQRLYFYLLLFFKKEIIMVL